VYVADALFTPSDAIIVRAPLDTGGIVTVHERSPTLSEPQLDVAGAPSSVKVIG
jgi:hypothetical protein